MTNYRLKKTRNLNKEALDVRNYVLNNLHKGKKKSNVVYLTVTAIVSIAMIAFIVNVFEQSPQLSETANHATPAIEGVNSEEVNEKIEELSTVWATALKTRDGTPRYEMMSEKAKEKFVQEQILASGENWNYVIGYSSPWVVSFDIQIEGMTVTITYDMQTSEASNYSKIETIHFIEDKNGEMVVDDYKSTENNENVDNKPSDTQPLETKAEVIEEDFVYRLVVEKAEYGKNEPIQIYAELEYTGDKEEIKISHSASPFSFPMVETTRNYEIGYNMDAPLLSTKLIKGEPLRKEYRGSGGYGSENKKEYIDFMRQIMNRKFPEGHYVVNGIADFYVIANEETKQKKKYNIKAQVEFRVKNSN